MRGKTDHKIAGKMSALQPMPPRGPIKARQVVVAWGARANMF